MLHRHHSHGKATSVRQRELIVAYLTYALDDVSALSEAASRYLQMTIASINDDVGAEATRLPEPAPSH
jgi:hypothetical protein